VLQVNQVNSYYPFGMNINGLTSNISGGRAAYNSYYKNEYLYNGNPDSYREFQDELGLDWLDYGARMYDAKLGRWHVVDPMTENYFDQSPFHFSGNNPLKFVDLNGMNYDEYLFNSDGKYTGKIKKEGEHYGIKAGGTGETAIKFSFADPINDPKAIDNGDITRVVEVGNDAIASTLDESGVNKKENQKNKYTFIKKESDATKGNGKMDYLLTAKISSEGQKQPISSNILYITTTETGKVAHNNYNFGNFLWGAGAKSLGIPRFVGKMGAHYNNYFNDPKHKGKLDSKDDQHSISLGYEWRK